MCADQRVEMHDYQQTKYKPLDRDAILRMSAAGLSQHKIATALGVSQAGVNRVLQDARRGAP